MKSLQELQAIRDKVKQQVEFRKEHNGYRVVVGMATCGIVAGARPVMTTFLELLGKEKLDNVIVTQSGCIGVCRLEPIVEIYDANNEKVTYVNMTSERATKVFESHLKNGTIIKEYTIGHAEQKKK